MSEVVGVAALILIPGLAVGLALYPTPENGVVTRIAISLGLGYTVVASVSFLLAALSMLYAPLLLACLVVATVASAAVAIRKGTLDALRVALWKEVTHERWVLTTGCIVLIAIAVVRWNYSPLVNLTETAPWRYWADALEIADAHGLPDASLQWGTALVPTMSKVLLNSFDGAFILLIDKEPLRGMRALLWIVALGQALVLWALGRELGLRWTGILLPVLLIANTALLNEEMTVDLFRFTAEGFGRLVAFCALVVGVIAVRDGRTRDAIVSGTLFAVGALTHLVPAVVAVAMLVCYALALGLRQRLARVARASAIIGAVTCLVAATGWLMAGGDLGFEGAASSNRYTSFGAFDPTRYFATGDGRPAGHTGVFYDPPAALLSDFVKRATGLAPSAFLVLVVTIGVTALAAAMAMWLPPPLRTLGVSVWGLGAVIVVVTLAFSAFYEVHVPARFGPRRLYDYSSLPLVLMTLGLLEGLVLSVRTRPWTVWATAAGTVVIAALLLPSSGPPARLEALGRASLPALDWIRANVECDARLLSSRRTAGTFQALAGRQSVDEGMAPYLRPRILARATDLLRATGRFLERPTPAGRRLLSSNGVDYVVVVRGRTLGSEGDYVERVDDAGLQRQAFLERVFRSPAVDVYGADVGEAALELPRAGDFPGYECRRASISASAHA